MITRSQTNKQAPAECVVKTVGQRSRPIHPHSIPISVQQPSTSPSVLRELPEARGRKRRRALEPNHDRPTKRPKDQPLAPDPVPSPSFTPLNRKDLDNLERLSEMAASNSIGRATTPSGRGGKKRSLSRHSSTADMEQETWSNSSQRTSTLANYRWRNLDDARILVEAIDVPNNIERWVDAIIRPDLSAPRQSELGLIADTFCNGFSTVMKGAGREDDSLELIHTALSAMDKDWDASLKPSTQRKTWQFKTPANNPDASTSHNVAIPQQQQEEDPRSETFYMSPASSGSIMPPPALPPSTRQDNPGVKTPRPDITVGLRLDLLVDALKSQGLGEIEARDFLKDLQYQQALYSNPLQPIYPLCFPSLVVEGKSYSTGKTIFEAQNQAAVSGPCMTNLQQMLSDLTELHCVEPLPRRKEPLAFSICSEGPILQLWVHYTTLVDKVRIHNMNILKICHASRRPSLREDVRNFLFAVDGIMKWACSDFLDQVVRQLVLVWRAVKPIAG
ncbi:MAG: hypothetical protein Q9207_007682 [Kuettlingeria erythrocarpa]